MRVTGTIINYYFHCKRQCYLFYKRLNLEDNSEDVRIGKVLHEISLTLTIVVFKYVSIFIWSIKNFV